MAGEDMVSIERETISVVDSADPRCPDLPIVTGQGSAKAVMWPGNGAKHRTFHLVELALGAKTIPLSHDGECVYYIISGAGNVLDLETGAAQAVIKGSMIHIGAHDTYQIVAGGRAGLKFIGGPCPADPRLYEKLQTRAGENV